MPQQVQNLSEPTQFRDNKINVNYSKSIFGKVKMPSSIMISETG